jgi:zinc/manganese transport system substrate-binding protein
MDQLLRILVAWTAACIPLSAAAALNVFACEPEWAALAKELGGDKASVSSATTALQDPHRLEARPSLIARMRRADLLVCTGAELEAGWLPVLLAQSGNAKIQAGAPGNLEASQVVPKLEVPGVVDRSLGDIHPSGNPHVQLDPRNIARVADALAERMARLDPGDAAAYRERASSFRERWTAAMRRWDEQKARLRGVPLVVYHRDFSYFIAWAGMREAGALEPKPGIPPSPSHLAELVDQMKRDPARVIVYSPYSDPRAAQFLSERTGIPSTMMPFTVGGTERAKDLFGLFDDTLARLLAVLK